MDLRPLIDDCEAPASTVLEALDALPLGATLVIRRSVSRGPWGARPSYDHLRGEYRRSPRGIDYANGDPIVAMFGTTHFGLAGFALLLHDLLIEEPTASVDVEVER